jgi:hypothetical protein
MKFKFLGTPECPDTITLRGVVFDKGKAVEVADEGLCAKLAALDYFAEVKVGRPKKGDE